jgi:hypothetical protein
MITKRIADLSELFTVLLAAKRALRSYQYGNAAPDLAEETANAIDAAVEKYATEVDKP